jgi:hypothetical protein
MNTTNIVLWKLNHGISDDQHGHCEIVHDSILINHEFDSNGISDSSVQDEKDNDPGFQYSMGIEVTQK